MIDLGPLERDSTVDRVVQALRQGIISGRIPPGTQLRVASFAEMLGTSQGSVREAIRQLATEGLVDQQLHKGAFVRVLTGEDTHDVFVARQAIEGWAAQRIVDSTDDFDFSPLQAAIDRMRDEAVEGAPTRAVIDADMDFHHSFVNLAGSERLTAIHETLVAETKLLLHAATPWPGKSYAPIHQELFDALTRRDQDAPSRVCRHLRMAAKLMEEPSEDDGGNDTEEPESTREEESS